jgi:hypothetical protein
MTTETITGTRDIGHRLAHGEIAFEASLVEIAGVTEDEAFKMRTWMTKKKLTTRDFGTGRISVKHGAYLDKDILLRIRDEVTK